MSRVIAAHIWDAIERTAAQFGGVDSGCTGGWGTAHEPRCPWGMAMYAGVVDTSPYDDGTYTFFGRQWGVYAEPSPLPTAADFDRAIHAVKRASALKGSDYNVRVSWAAVAKEMGLVRGQSGAAPRMLIPEDITTEVA